jgi:hypothetical protein
MLSVNSLRLIILSAALLVVLADMIGNLDCKSAEQFTSAFLFYNPRVKEGKRKREITF